MQLLASGLQTTLRPFYRRGSRGRYFYLSRPFYRQVMPRPSFIFIFHHDLFTGWVCLGPVYSSAPIHRQVMPRPLILVPFGPPGVLLLPSAWRAYYHLADTQAMLDGHRPFDLSGAGAHLKQQGCTNKAVDAITGATNPPFLIPVKKEGNDPRQHSGKLNIKHKIYLHLHHPPASKKLPIASSKFPLNRFSRG